MTFWTVWTLDTIKRNIFINQLSETKIYAHPNVNKSRIARLKKLGIYGCYRKLADFEPRIFSPRFRKKALIFLPVLSANVKSSTSTMVYIAGIFHLAPNE